MTMEGMNEDDLVVAEQRGRTRRYCTFCKSVIHCKNAVHLRSAGTIPALGACACWAVTSILSIIAVVTPPAPPAATPCVLSNFQGVS